MCRAHAERAIAVANGQVSMPELPAIHSHASRVVSNHLTHPSVAALVMASCLETDWGDGIEYLLCYAALPLISVFLAGGRRAHNSCGLGCVQGAVQERQRCRCTW